MGVSRRSYAAQRGVSEAAVRKAIATGRITTLPDGTIDPTRADSEWGAQTDHVKWMGPHALIGTVAEPPRSAGIGPGRKERTERAVLSCAPEWRTRFA